MTNLYWPVFKNLEKEVLKLSNQIHFDDKQLSVYSIRISDLLIRSVVEIEAISKDLFFRLEGITPSEGDLYFDTHCIQLLEDKWKIGKKKLIISAPSFYFQNEEIKIISPLHNANKRGTSSCDWKKAYQAVKHNRTMELCKGNIKNLLKALGALFILNIYFKDEVYNFEKDSKATNFPINMGSDIFAIKLHKWFSYDGNLNYRKRDDFDECIYITKFTDDSIEKYRQANEETMNKQTELFCKHHKLLKYLETNNFQNYKGKNLMLDVLGQDDYIKLIQTASQKQHEVLKNTKYEAILNKNSV